MAATEPMRARLRPLPSYSSLHERERVAADPPHKREGSTTLDGRCEGRAR